jgi:hypothetical protein
MEKNLKAYAEAAVGVKRFTYLRKSELVVCKPAVGEKFVIAEDYLGDRSILWVACYENGAEVWRHNIGDIVRITYDKPVA